MQRFHLHFLLLETFLIFLGSPLLRAADSPWVSDQPTPGAFPLVSGNQTATLFVESDDFPVVRIAAGNLADDIQRVTGQKPVVSNSPSTVTAPVVLIGTVGYSPLIDSLISKGLLDVSAIKDKWESFLITTIPNPNPNNKTPLLVIVGSDRRGTAYGAFELSSAIGVSPWYWWADVPARHHDQLFVAAGTRHFGPPSVQYRGIFINDEDWGMHVWASKTFEPEVGNIGPKTYAKIFELLLRLKANTLWPAMHDVSTPFNAIPENRVVADQYAIVMGSSHCEPMLRNNVGEWPKDQQPAFNFLTNPAGVTAYWEQRVKENGQYENIYTIGMRGIHDGPMQGPRGQAQVVDTLEKIFNVQRNLLGKYVNPDPTKVPQIFCPYKEVLAYYLDNLVVPPDVTIVFPDDNFGYIRYFPTPAEIAARPGGFGVYYHISYLGAPFSYVWLNTTPPALIWEEMSKAYDHGMKKLWILNVGDLKPGEIGIDFFLQMAWDINKWNLQTLPNYLQSWATQQFGPGNAHEIASLMMIYYRLTYARKPEELQWYLGKGEKPRPSDISYINNDEDGLCLYMLYGVLEQGVAELSKKIPRDQQDAFYELVGYPLLGAAAANKRFLADEIAAVYLQQGRAEVSDWNARFREYTDKLSAETDQFDHLANGKWKGMMDDDLLLKSRLYRTAALTAAPGTGSFQPSSSPGIGIAIPNRIAPLHPGESAELPAIGPVDNHTFVNVFATGSGTGEWTLTINSDWIKLLLTPQPWGVQPDKDKPQYIQPHQSAKQKNSSDLWIGVDWSKAPQGNTIGNIVISDGNSTYTILVPFLKPSDFNPDKLIDVPVESNGIIYIHASRFAHKVDQPGSAWQSIFGLGRDADNAVGVFPTTAPSLALADSAKAPVLVYPFYLFHPGNVTVHFNLIPTQPIRYGQGLRFAYSIDDQPPQLVTITAGTGKEVTNFAWSHNVLDNSTSAAVPVTIAAPGAHTLKIYGLDPGVLLEKIVLDAGGLRPSYLGPPETLATFAK